MDVVGDEQAKQVLLVVNNGNNTAQVILTHVQNTATIMVVSNTVIPTLSGSASDDHTLTLSEYTTDARVLARADGHFAYGAHTYRVTLRDGKVVIAVDGNVVIKYDSLGHAEIKRDLYLFAHDDGAFKVRSLLLGDPSRTAVIGYSMGGYGVLSAAGAILDPQGGAVKLVPGGLMLPFARVSIM